MLYALSVPNTFALPSSPHFLPSFFLQLFTHLHFVCGIQLVLRPDDTFRLLTVAFPLPFPFPFPFPFPSLVAPHPTVPTLHRTILLYGCIAILTLASHDFLPWLKVTPNEFRSVFLVAYGVYMIENLGSAISSQIWRLDGIDEDGRERIRKMLDMPPWIRWTLHSFHYPNALAEEEGRPGNRIRTGTNRGEFAIFGCADATNTPPFTSHQLCKLEFKMARDFRDAEAEERWVYACMSS